MTDDERTAAGCAADAWIGYYENPAADRPPHLVTWLNQARWEEAPPRIPGRVVPSVDEHAAEWDRIAVIVRRHGPDEAIAEIRRGVRPDEAAAWLAGYHARYPDPLYAIPADRVVPGATVTA